MPLISLLVCSGSIAQKAILSTELTPEELILKRSQYKKQLEELESFRAKTLTAHKAADTEKKKRIISQVRTRLETELTQHVFPAWHGTPWDFNGTSNKPGEGKIACGYFVSTTLEHIGYQVNRYKLAQQPSQRIITTFVERGKLDISSRRPLAKVKKKLVTSGNGIYIIGLDTHVGYVVVNGEDITFIHSTYYPPAQQVVAEPYDTKNPLSDSKYRVVGKLFHDEMLINWLHQKRYSITQ